MKKTRLLPLAMPALFAALLLGCPPNEPPFDATGRYEGTWSGTIETKATYEVADCPLVLRLEQRPSLPLLRFHVAGLLTAGWDCLLPQEVLDALSLEPGDITLPVLAVMDADGALTLNVEIDPANIPAILRELLDLDEVGDVPLRTFQMALDAQGEDTDGDGTMDVLAGTISLAATYDDDGTVKSVSLSGVFGLSAQ